MRVQLIGLVLATLTARAAPTGAVEVRADRYADQWIEVYAPSVRVELAWPTLRVEARHLVDTISGATYVLPGHVDGLSAPTQVAEIRHQSGVSITHAIDAETRVGGRVDLSVEPDYRTHAVGVQLARDLLDRAATLTVALGASLERLGTTQDPTFGEWTQAWRLDATWDQILGPRTKGRVLLSGGAAWCGELAGCRASPYRFVAVTDDDIRIGALPERHPERLARIAVGGGLSQAIGAALALHLDTRGYTDSWGVIGQTTDASLAVQLFAERLLLRANGRFAVQGPARFQSPDLALDDGPAKYRTASRELSGLRAWTAGGRAEWWQYDVGPFLRVGVSVRASHTRYHYANFPTLPERRAWILGGGLDAEF